MSLLSVGTVAFDDIQTPFGHAEKVVGGAATYISMSASNFVEEQRIVSVIGDDFPESELKYLKGRGVDLDGLQIKKGEKSFFWAGKYHKNMNVRDTLDTQLNVLEHFDPILPEGYKDSSYLMLGNLTPAVQQKVLDQLNDRPELIALDTMNFWMDVALDQLKEVIGQVDVLMINDEEAMQLSGENTIVDAAKVVLKMGPKYLVIKKGEHGAMLFHKNKIFYSPALPLDQVYDPTGAGDTFAGGFMGYIASSKDTSFENLKRAMVYGSVMASFCVEDFGTSALKGIKKTSIENRISRMQDLVSVKF